MTSKLVVNTIEADTGISSVSFASSISLSSTSKFFFSDAGIDIGPDTNINRPATGVLGFNINSSEKMRLDSSGRVLIGTTTEGQASSDDLTIAGSGNQGMTIRSGSSNAGTIHFSDGTSGTAEYEGAIQYAHSNNTMTFSTNHVERLRITSTGNIGIGTNNPTTNLHIVSDKNALIKLVSTDAYAGVQFVDPDTGSKPPVIYGAGDDFTIWTNWTERLRVKLDGKIGIGVTNPDSNLEINRGSEGKYLTVGGDDASNGRGLSFTSSEGGTGSNGALHTINAKSGNGAIALATTGTERFRIDRNGYVTMPYRPAFKCAIVTSQSSPNSGVVSENNGFTLNSTSSRDAFNNGSHFSEATGRFTAPVTGLYFFHFSVMRYSNYGNGSVDLRIKKNSSLIYARSYKASYDMNFESLNVTTITNMSAGHYVEFVIGANMSVYSDDSYMLGYLLG